jgi:hypothetical protein
MLQTGSLGGNPFSHIGFSSLGAQSFMHGMFLTFSSIADINAFDSIICLLLSLGLLRELGKKFGVNMVFILAACALALLINPQYVNVSSLYSGTLMLLGLTYGTMLLTESLAATDSAVVIRAAVPCSLFLAALLSLKTTHVFVAPLFWAASLAGSLLLIKERRRVLLAHFASAAVAIALLIPWITVHLDRYIQKIRYVLAGISYPGFSVPGSGPNLTDKDLVLGYLFSNEASFYGNTFRDFLYINIMLLLALALACWVVRRRRDRRKTVVLLLPLLVLVVSVIGNYLFYFKFASFRAEQFTRYVCPLLIGAAPLAVLLAGWLWREGFQRRGEKANLHQTPLVLGGLLLGCQLAVAGMFLGTFVERIKLAENNGTLISFPLANNPRYLDYNAYALSNEAANRISWLQNLVPAGETIFAWVSLPMHLDYGRNHIFPTAEFGLSNPLLVMPLTEGASGMRRFFQQRGIRYFIWEYQGYGIKPQAQLKGLQREFIRILTEMIPASRILYNDGSTIVFEI